MARLGGQYAILSEAPDISWPVPGEDRTGSNTIVATVALMRHMKRTAGRAMCQHIAKNAVASTAIAMVDLHALRRMEHLMEQLDPDSRSSWYKDAKLLIR
ncbi:hypothetical protein MAJ_07858, partial [Metarhizium majus ARSEF 297]